MIYIYENKIYKKNKYVKILKIIDAEIEFAKNN